MDGNVEVIEREVPSIRSSQSSLLEEVLPDGNHKKKRKIQKNHHQIFFPLICLPLHQPSIPILPPPQSINPQLVLITQSNYLPYYLPFTIVKAPVPSTFPFEAPTSLPIITEEEIPNSSIPKHPPNVAPSRSSQHQSPHFKNDQSFEVPANSIPNSPAQVHPLTQKNEIIQEELHYSIVANNSSPNVPSNATTPHVVSTPMQINHEKCSHILSAPHF
ncbi:hypothetical protein O181_024622 [Austropuccinia psidii MF-1]|uniref:Uncharacterized protein n=1 Tax=Austropuccinia psidii MF-1 TaxID=1389203 RepID=A0A9Q3CLV4_9BASI|nr:hypothetical protein [Austropuccinia psidii MF-1]